MELSCSCTSLLMSYSLLPTKPSSLSSSNSLFFSNAYAALSRKKNPISVSVQRAGPTSRRGLGCRCLFGLGVPELVVIAGVAALVFGPKQLPEIGRNIGKTLKNFQQAAKEFETELKKEPEEGSIPTPPEGAKAVSSKNQQGDPDS